MKSPPSLTLLDHFVAAALPTMLNINNGDIPDAVADAYETALEVLRCREEFHGRAAEFLSPGLEENGPGGEGERKE